jgi:hypothetical protein
MKISQLIKQLEKLKNKLGDVPMLVEVKGFGGYAMHTVDSVAETCLHTGDFEEENNFTEEEIKEMIPTYDPEKDDEFDCVEIKIGSLIYAT